MLLDDHREFVRCDFDLDILRAAKPDLLSAFALQDVDRNCEITGEKEV